jgi:hypothetical protein
MHERDGAHFAVGCLVDEGGDDVHSLSDFPGVGLGPKAGAGIGFGWDVVNALLFERAGPEPFSPAEQRLQGIACQHLGTALGLAKENARGLLARGCDAGIAVVEMWRAALGTRSLGALARLGLCVQIAGRIEERRPLHDELLGFAARRPVAAPG